MKTKSTFSSNAAFVIALSLACFGSSAKAQVFLLRENFAIASGNTPPPGWKNEVVQGNKAATWRFDNMGNRPLSQPFSNPYAIFDTRAVSLNAANQSAYLESPSIDAPQAGSLVLSFDNLCDIDTGGTCKLQVLNNDQWVDVRKFERSTLQARNEVVDISASIKPGAPFRFRFLWEGKQSGFWAIDNIRVFIPSSVDAGISALNSPITPFGEGQSEIKVTLTNYGASNLVSANIRWSIEGVPQSDYVWRGSLPLGSSAENIRIGAINMKAGVNYNLKAWSESPNGTADVNPSNDSIARALIPSLCGDYTIGGSNPDFPTMTRAVEFLNNAGVGCPVRFKIRDGVYAEQFEIVEVKGASFKNTVTFESESGDSSRVKLTSIHDISSYPYTLKLNGSRHLRFKNITISKDGTYWDYWALEVAGDSYDIDISNCLLNPTMATAVYIRGNSDSIAIRRSHLTGSNSPIGIAVRATATGSTTLTDNLITSFSSHGLSASSGTFELARNRIERVTTGIDLDSKGRVNLNGNRISRVKSGIVLKGTGSFTLTGNKVSFGSGTGIQASVSKITMLNNWVTDGFNNGSPSASGIALTSSKDVRLYHNSVHLTRSVMASSAMNIDGGSAYHIENNVFSVKQDGVPMNLGSLPTDYRSDRNAYFSPNKIVGQLKDVSYRDMDAWRQAVKGEKGGVFCNPFFSFDTLPTPNQILLNNAGSVIPGIRHDIDSTLRDTLAPDIGAKEFSACTTDAGISLIVTPENPLNPGLQDVSVSLTNQGAETLSSASIKWSVNGESPVTYGWKGVLSTGQSAVVVVGSYDFKPVKEYVVKAWTELPNGKADCNNLNDTSSTVRMFTRLCGTYTIGGSNPDFKTIGQAVDVLNRSGVGCAVTFRIRDGVYTEQLRIDSIPGATSKNTVTFESESGDSSRVTLTSKFDVSPSPYTVLLNSTRHLRFRKMGLSKLGTYWDYWALEVGGGSYDIEVSNCNLSQTDASAINIKDSSDAIAILRNHIRGSSTVLGFGIRMNTKGTVRIIGNVISSFAWYGIGAWVGKIEVSKNRISRISRGMELDCSDSASVTGNDLDRLKDGIFVRGQGAFNLSGNRVSFGSGVGIHASVSKSTIHNNWVFDGFNDGGIPLSGITIEGGTDIRLYFNSVQLARNAITASPLTIQSGNDITVENNIFALRQEGYPVKLANLPNGYKADRNGYFSPTRFVGSVKDVAYRDMAEWRLAVKGEKNGVFCNPFFTNDSTLAPNQILLNNAASPIPRIRHDIDSTLRDTLAPDIGAKEFTPCANDASVSLILSPENPLTPGILEIKVSISNQGMDPLTSASVKWSANNEPPATFSWKGSLTSGQSTELVLGTYDFKGTRENGVKAWTELPNGKTDCNNRNDTSSTVRLFAKLCGTYTIGGSNPDFKTVGHAVDILNSAGVGCAVTFKIRDGVYTEQLRIDSIPGATPKNTVTFESESGDSTRVTITSKFDVSASPYTVFLNSTRHLRFRKLGLSKRGTYWDYWALEIGGEAYDIEVSNCNLTQIDAGAVVIKDKSDSILIRRNLISGEGIGFGIRLATSGFAGITDNQITSFAWFGTAGYARRLDVSRNRISRIPKGLEIEGWERAIVTGNEFNKVKDGAIIRGNAEFTFSENKINFGSGTGLNAIIRNSLVSNNWIRNTDSVSTNGMMFTNSSKNRVLFNSINISGKNNNSSALSMEDSREMSLQNNVFRNMAGGYCMKVIGDIVDLKADHNNYFAPLSNIALHNAVTYTYLKDWGNLIKGESNGIFCNPFFANDSSYRPNHILLDKSGMPSEPVTRDIDSVQRDPVSPDIGVKEFQPCDLDAGINEFTMPRVSVSDGRQNVMVVLQNQGLLEVRSVTIHWTVNGLPQVPVPWRGTLAFKKNIEVDLGQFNFTKGMEYTLKAWTVGPNDRQDCNAFNDTSFIRIPGVQQPADALRLEVMPAEGDCGSMVEVPIRSYSFADVSSLKFSLNWDTSKVAFDKALFSQSDSLAVTDKNFDYSQTGKGSLVFSWKRTAGSPTPMRDTASLFKLRLKTVASSTTSTQVVFSNTPDSIIVRDKDSNPMTYVALEGYLLIRCTTQVAGRVYAPSNQGLANTVVAVVSKDSIGQMLTDKDGRYAMKTVSRDASIRPLPKRETSRKNGVTTLDISLIQAHILLKTTLSAPFGVIAADVDSSSTVTTRDILHIRRLILDYDTVLPGNRSWTYVDSLHRFTNPASPFPFPSEILVKNHPENVPMSFIGMKMGDVNLDRNPLLEQAPSGDTLRLYCEWVEEADGVVRARLKTRGIAGVMGYQTALRWDPKVIALESVDANPMGISTGDRWTGKGQLMLSWNDVRATGLTITEGMSLLELRFRRLGTNTGASLTLSEEHIPTEAFNANYQSVGVRLEPNSLPAGSRSSGLRVYPNPAGREVNLEWRNEASGQVTIRLLDATGRLAYVHKGFYEAGVQRHVIHRDRTATSAASYIVQVESNGRIMNGTVVTVNQEPTP